jgi:hypothetical protein
MRNLLPAAAFSILDIAGVPGSRLAQRLEEARDLYRAS